MTSGSPGGPKGSTVDLVSVPQQIPEARTGAAQSGVPHSPNSGFIKLINTVVFYDEDK